MRTILYYFVLYYILLYSSLPPCIPSLLPIFIYVRRGIKVILNVLSSVSSVLTPIYMSSDNVYALARQGTRCCSNLFSICCTLIHLV